LIAREETLLRRPLGTFLPMDRRSANQLLATLVLVGLLAGCGVARVEHEVLSGNEPVPAGPLAPVIQRAGAPPLECRGMPQPTCESSATEVDASGMGIAEADIVRVILTCTVVRCTAQNGEYRVDLLRRDGQTFEVMGGAYGVTE
jgi:hypothetical protein